MNMMEDEILPTDESNNNLINEVIKRYHGNQMKEELAVSGTTEPSLCVKLYKSPGKSVIPYNNNKQVAMALGSLIKTGHKFSVEDVSRIVSIHHGRLKEAKNILLSEVLPKLYNAPARQDVISNLGIALNKQVDQNRKIHNNKSVGDSINEKLQYLGLDKDKSKLYKKHESLNRYYNAVKHSGRPNSIRLEKKLKDKDGLIITIDYFETVRRIFRWYYKKHGEGIPDWDELKPIKYPDFNMKYRFRYERLW